MKKALLPLREKGWDEGCSAEGGKVCAPSPQPLSRKGRGALSGRAAIRPEPTLAVHPRRCDTPINFPIQHGKTGAGQKLSHVHPTLPEANSSFRIISPLLSLKTPPLPPVPQASAECALGSGRPSRVMWDPHDPIRRAH
ncbi:hypothetical protein EJ913_27425 [Azospirillum doebereinerae]|uniref:Uncharacterized protein n=1 Tax=Azospirillum doebereinerae TaxID=92933 RepID=A0A3S0WR66_9PROT|nr:hypothetical protein EJ913_27425 [Azospirillum doebereinerae]